MTLQSSAGPPPAPGRAGACLDTLPPTHPASAYFASGGGRQDRADSAVAEPGVNQAEDAAIH